MHESKGKRLAPISSWAKEGVPSRQAVFGFLIPATVLAILARWWPGIPWVIGDTLFTLTLLAYIFFVIRGRRKSLT